MNAPSTEGSEQRQPSTADPRWRTIPFAIVIGLLALASVVTAGLPGLIMMGIIFVVLEAVTGFGMFALISAAKPGARPQFSLWSILVWMTIFSVLMAAAAAWGAQGFLLAAVGALALSAIRGAWRRPEIAEVSWPFLAVFGMSAICLCGFLLPAINVGSRTSTPRQRCSLNLKQIGIALWSYHDEYGSFPPAYIADQSGKPMHSWRVLILPFAEQLSLYEQYDFAEPWDGPHNRLLAAQVPPFFACPSDTRNSSAETNFVAIVGAGTAWPGAKCTTGANFLDGTGDTLLVVEMESSGINWMEPRDLNLSHASRGLNPKIGRGVSSEHQGGVNVLYADGDVDFLPDTVSAKELKAMLTIAGGEKTMKP